MTQGRVFTVDSGQVQVTVATQTPLLMVQAYASGSVQVPVSVQALRIGVFSLSGASYSSNATVQPYFARVNNSPAGGTAITPTSHRANGTTPAGYACTSAWTIGSWGTAPTCPGPTAGGVLWGEPFALTAGSGWGEWVTPSSEWEIAAGAYGAFFITCSTAPTNTAFAVEMVFGE